MSSTLGTRYTRVTDLRMGDRVALAMWSTELDTVVRVERGEVPGQSIILYASGRNEYVAEDARRTVLAA